MTHGIFQNQTRITVNLFINEIKLHTTHNDIDEFRVIIIECRNISGDRSGILRFQVESAG